MRRGRKGIDRPLPLQFPQVLLARARPGRVEVAGRAVGAPDPVAHQRSFGLGEVGGNLRPQAVGEVDELAAERRAPIGRDAQARYNSVMKGGSSFRKGNN